MEVGSRSGSGKKRKFSSDYVNFLSELGMRGEERREYRRFEKKV